MLVFQGFLLPMLLYDITVEVLDSFNNADKRMQGIETEDHEIKKVSFADSTTIFLTLSQHVLFIHFRKKTANFAVLAVLAKMISIVTIFSIRFSLINP